MKPPSNRLQNLPGNFFAALEQRIAALQIAGRDVIRLDIGSPDLPPHPAVLEALDRAARKPDHHGYQPHAGPLRLRQAWSEMYRQVHGVELDPENEVLPLLGSKEGIFHLSMAWVNPGEAVLLPDPGYMTYTRGTLFAGGEPCPLPLRPEGNYLPDLEDIPAQVVRKARLLWLNYPHNPTAAVAGLDFFSQAVGFARQHDLLLCHDAAYSRVTFDGYRAPSLLEIPGAKEVALEFNSLSKSHNMPGWRVGVVVGNAEVLRHLFRLKTNVDSGHFLPVMEAAVTAMACDPAWLAERNEIYRQRRDVLLRGLQALGLPAIPPRASIYVWAAVPPGWTCLDFTASVLEETAVSLTPGTVFGAQGEGYVRLAFTTPVERLEEAVYRLSQWKGKAQA